MAKAKRVTKSKPAAKPKAKKAAAAKPAKKVAKPAAAKKIAVGKATKPAKAAKPAKANAKILPAWQARLVTRVRNLMASASPGSKESIKGDQTVYEVNGPFAYLKALPGAVNFGFWRGADLDDPGRLLISDGPRMRYVKLVEGGEFPEERLVAFIQQAVVLNLVNGDPTRG